GSVAKLWIGLLLLALIAGAVAWIGTAGQQWARTASGLQYRVVKDGQGAAATAEDFAILEYTGRLQDGTIFDSNVGKQPAVLPVRPGGLIAGFSEGLRMMKKGGVYKLRIPGKLGYGEHGQPPAIPPNATLDFDIKVLDVVPEETLRAMMMQQQMQQQAQGQGQGQAPPPQ
ncbi:MAG: FKBP-type peptidyl-prolyl cis-trans isomerase, partial [Alphaproteobacteria bacterium]|nr:FKBP-type peptidyl-prolyl cis-trans isomerase [Alphaproteobacteria bacterium]